MSNPTRGRAAWPELPLAEWQPTLDTLQMWLQIIGKIKLELVPFLNQWWNVTLLPTARGLTTGVIPYGERVFEIELDFLNHRLSVRDSDGAIRTIQLHDRSVATFYAELMQALADLDIQVTINPVPVEVPTTIPLDRNQIHSTYDPEYVTRWSKISLNITRVLQTYCSGFTGKSSPIQFFWGSFDLSQTRFSGKPAEPPAGAPRFFQLAENEENVACGFWPGNTSAAGITFGEPALYSYIYPQPPGFPEAIVQPDAAYFDTQMGLFVLRYDDVRRSPDPEQDILAFFEGAYEAAASAANWDHDRLTMPRQ